MGSSTGCTSANCSQQGAWSGIGSGPTGQWRSGPRVFAQCSGARVPQWLYLSVREQRTMSAFVLLICLSGVDNHAEVALVSAPLCVRHVRPSPSRAQLPSLPFSQLHDWSLRHCPLAAGGNLGNLVNPLTTNCLLLPWCLDKQARWGGCGGPIKVGLEQEEAQPLHGSLHFSLCTLTGGLDFGIFLDR
ncbi:unnamed protein product [Pleuronectes platessa]|uniref:Uncharacterized protein n=1 Tax=Pleuronectes platessa TaxID=8262 RepID=A0A9N7V8A3_PLEPL|nr:unnamed protein product [Pleuronectes platessa]